MNKLILFLVFIAFATVHLVAQTSDDLTKGIKQLQNYDENLDHKIDQMQKQVDDILWYNKVGDIAHVDKLYIYGPPKWKEQNPTAKDAGNPVKFWTYVFVPKNVDVSKKYPLIVLPHGGVHADFTTYYTHIVRERVSQGYVIVAPEYRGSTGYGKGHYEKIDYGGLETADVYYSRNYMLENYDFIGKNTNDDVEEYRRRSPVWNTEKFEGTPLLIHTNTNDEDVNVLEVEHLIKSLKAEGKPFEYEIFESIPGGHSFDRMDTKIAKEIRLKIHFRLAKYLKPENPYKSLKDLQKAAYKF